MYQVEDLIRANRLDLDSLEQTLISKFDVPYGVKRDMREWYGALIRMMIDEQKEISGHLAILENISEQLHEMHHEIIKLGIDSAYREGVYNRAKPNIEALRKRSGQTRDNDIQVAFNGLYGLLILKLKKTSISKETLKAFETIKELVAELSFRYMEG